MSITSEEVNYLIWRYLQETGNELSALALQEETRVKEFDEKYKQHIPIGTLVNLVQKGILYCESELLVENLDQKELFGKNGEVKRKLDEYVGKTDGSVFNLVNALRLDAKSVPEIESTGRFALVNDDIERNPNYESIFKKGAAVSDKSTSANISSKVESSPTIENVDNTNNSLSIIGDLSIQLYIPHWKKLYTIKENINYLTWNPKQSHILSFGIKKEAVAKIVKFNLTTDIQSPLVVGEIHELRHPFALSYTTGNTSNEITCLEWSLDGQHILTGVENGEIRLWTNDGLLKNVFNFHRVPIISMKWNHDNTLFLSLDVENVVILWNALTGTVIQHFELMKSNSGNLDSNNNNVGIDISVDIRDNKLNELKNRKSGNDDKHNNLNGVEISWVDTDKFVLPAIHGRLNVYTIHSKTPIGKLIGHERLISDIKFNDSNKLLATCSDDMTVRIWYGTSSNSSYCFLGHSQNIVSMEWINDDLLITCSLDGSIRVWSLSKQSLVGIKLYEGIPIICGKLSHDGSKYITGLLNGHINLFDVSNFLKQYEHKKTQDNFTEPLSIPLCGEYSVPVPETSDNNTTENDMVFDMSWDEDNSEIAISYSNKPGVILSI
ncbi:SIR4-interacting protein Sif2p [Monosporozyma unispora]|nr:hypothetical protein C6P44_000190 [Kazachstania unispora]